MGNQLVHLVCTSTFTLENRLESSLSIGELHENGGVSKVAVELVIVLLCHVSAYYVTSLNVQRHLNRRITCFYFVRTRVTKDQKLLFHQSRPINRNPEGLYLTPMQRTGMQRGSRRIRLLLLQRT